MISYKTQLLDQRNPTKSYLFKAPSCPSTNFFFSHQKRKSKTLLSTKKARCRKTMALAPPFLSTTKPFPCISSSISYSTSSSLITFSLHKSYAVSQITLVPFCKQGDTNSSPPFVSKRSFALSLSSAFLLSLAGTGGRLAEAAPLEDEDDLELLEKVKKDRKKRIERQGIINSSTKEKGYLQDLVYKLSEVGQDIEKNDLNAAKSLLGNSTDTEWIKKANAAFTKLSLGTEEMEEVDTFNTSISKLISFVSQQDIESSKIAFVTSANAFEKWTTLTGLDAVLKGL